MEDHAVLREGLAAWLNGGGHGIRVMGRYGSWDELAAHRGALADVVLLDVLLGDDVPLREKIRSVLDSGSQVVIFSSLSGGPLIREAIDAGALSFLPKTSSARDVAAAVRLAAQGRRYMTAEMEQALSAGGVRLTPREHQVISLYLVGEGQSMERTGRELRISVDSVKKHLASVRRKLGIRGSRTGKLALREMLSQEGWLPPENGFEENR
ncbi:MULTISPECIES: response regulator transcription factor [Arthrobacter]|uniref:Response regulator transcription factor n=2 Tax=Arthrobacter TaxID=1663 RepID=A0ABU9KM97_9MICC|nr:response regulator transcription factor [Arthrobacter sp. YJM1]MDP5227701.1 response regulator transcription factor [Arthrobacter sp. YJM1]